MMKKTVIWTNASLCAALVSCVIVSPGVNAESHVWDGMYAGMSAGARNVDADWTTTSYQDPGSVPLAFGTNPNASLDSDDMYFNAFVGYNWQLKPQLIAGIEGELGYANSGKMHVFIPGVNTDLPPDFSFIDVDSDLEASLRGRVGYLVTPNVHVYGSFGASAIKVEVSAVCPADTDFCNPAMGTQSNSQSKILTGWTAGIGVETALKDQLFLRVAYNYADYGDLNFAGLPAIPGESFGFASNIDFKSENLTVGLGYTF